MFNARENLRQALATAAPTNIDGFYDFKRTKYGDDDAVDGRRPITNAILGVGDWVVTERQRKWWGKNIVRSEIDILCYFRNPSLFSDYQLDDELASALTRSTLSSGQTLTISLRIADQIEQLHDNIYKRRWILELTALEDIEEGDTMSTVTFADSFVLDAFGRLRISAPFTIFDSKQIFDNAPLFWDDAETSGNGTSSAHSTAIAASTLSVGNATAGTRVRQTKRRFNYQPGKSQLILLTGVLGDSAAGITRRVGYFDENNGLFFQLSGSTLSVVVRTSKSGSPDDTDVAQSSWNIDKMDGSGVSGVSIDTSKTNIFLIDFEWLGVGRVRFGFVVDGKIYYCHEVLNANNLTTVYMSTPNLPLRYEISNSGAGGASDLVHICASVISEGGQEDTGVVLSQNTGSTGIACNVVGTTYALIGMSLKSTHLAATIKNLSASILVTSVNDNFIWSLILNPTVTGTFTYNNLTNSACAIALGSSSPTVSGGTLLNSGHGINSAAESVGLVNALNLGSTIAGVSDKIVLCITPITTNQAVFASATWRELL